jgi:O-antigen ligase
LAVGAAAGVGFAASLALAALGSRTLAPALAAAALGGTALVLVLALGWIEPLALLALALPLPALVETDTFRLPPVLLMSVVVVAGWALGRGLDRRPFVPVRGSATALAVLVGAVLLSAPFAQEPMAAARESVNALLLLGLFLVAADRAGSRPGQAEAFAGWVSLAAAAAGAAGVLETLGVLPGRFPLADGGLFRASAGFGWPNELGMFLALSLPLAVHRWRMARGRAGRAWAAAGVLLIALGLAATFSRGSWLAAVAAPAVLLLVGERRLALGFWGVALAGAVAFDVASGGALSSRVAATGADPLVAQRLLLTGAGLLMFQAHPIVGVGPGGFGDALEAFGPQVAGLFDYVGSAHNGYVHVAAETGVIGLAAFLFFAGSTSWVLLRAAAARGAADVTARERSLRVALLWSFATACLVSLFEWPFAHGIGQLIVVVAALGRVLGARSPADAG